ncbi:MAG: glycosyltransferase family 39 protein [Erythrobacter sp.]|uniref:phospholipid carrier-dependent glycosyltransferase n=1 Tax=Erythrobacter sp. TaxID=1042 RepID=UPI00329914E2
MAHENPHENLDLEAELSPGGASASRVHPNDPWVWSLAICAVFAALASIRLAIPSTPLFDEVHYLPAARDMLDVWNGDEAIYRNKEHPLLGKTLIAIGMALFGDNPLGWRIMSLIAGIVTVGASMRAMWHASEDRFATLAFGVLLATGFHIFIHARIAMLDTFMLSAIAIAAWQFAAAIRKPEQGRWRLAFTGVAIGAAIGAKWNAMPLAPVFGLSFFILRLSAGRRRLLLSRRGAPVPGISLAEAFLWLGVMPLAIYALSFAPGYWLGTQNDPSLLAQDGIIAFHSEILSLQRQVLDAHPYQSSWDQWALNTRGIWYLYEEIDGAQRGVLLIGNPVTMLLGLPALLWCLGVGIQRRNPAMLAAVVGYAVSLGFWLIAPKPVQFYYHYTIPSVFLLGALALTLSHVRQAGWSKVSFGVMAASIAVFAWFFPILSAAPLEPPVTFKDWMWLDSWV